MNASNNYNGFTVDSAASLRGSSVVAHPQRTIKQAFEHVYQKGIEYAQAKLATPTPNAQPQQEPRPIYESLRVPGALGLGAGAAAFGAGDTLGMVERGVRNTDPKSLGFLGRTAKRLGPGGIAKLKGFGAAGAVGGLATLGMYGLGKVVDALSDRTGIEFNPNYGRYFGKDQEGNTRYNFDNDQMFRHKQRPATQ